MKKKQRVKKSHEFTQIIQKKKFIKTSAFILYFQPRKEPGARIGISVGKKLGNAVVRNKIKRQVRSMIDSCFDFQEPMDVILIVRPVYLKRDYAHLLEELRYARDKAMQRTPRQIERDRK